MTSIGILIIDEHLVTFEIGCKNTVMCSERHEQSLYASLDIGSY